MTDLLSLAAASLPLTDLAVNLLIGAVLTTALAWAVVLAVLTLIFGRFFCGWLCPMGTLHHALGWVGRLRRVPDRATIRALV